MTPTATPRRVIYTCVTNGYDRVIPPADPVPGVDYVLFTDRPDTDRVPGWQTRPIVTPEGLSPALRNRYYKLLPHKILPDHDESVYLDANIAITASLAPFLDDVFGGPENMVLFANPKRDTVAAEAATCLETGRVRDPEALRAEVAAYAADGFPDDVGLTGNSILMRRHHAPEVAAAMEQWWDLVSAHSGRDQVSLPFVRWRLGLECRLIRPHFSIESPYFHRYPHWSHCGLRGRAYIWSAAHLDEGALYRGLHALIAHSYGARAAI